VNLHELLSEWQRGRAVVTYDEARPDGISRASFYRMAAAGEIPGVLTLGRKRLLSLPVYLQWLGVPREIVWPAQGSCRCQGGANE
jgi:hypothetical protein